MKLFHFSVFDFERQGETVVHPDITKTHVHYIEKTSNYQRLTFQNMGIILWIIFGALAGWIASLIMHTDAEQGGIANIIVGILGAVIGGFVMSFIGDSGVTGFNLYSLLVAILGAVILIWIVKVLRSK